MLVLILILPAGVDYRGLGLKDLSHAISYLGQEPVMFRRDVRGNLDPENELTDGDIWKAIASCSCLKFVNSLDNSVSEYGNNFSVGVCQLLCLARVLLQRKNVL